MDKILIEIRDDLLKVTDWTQSNDSPLDADTKAAWATYRQALRDMPTSGLGFPEPPDGKVIHEVTPYVAPPQPAAPEDTVGEGE
jgi:hypothetical protein